MHDAHNGPCDYPNGPCPTQATDAQLIALTAMIDQAYEGTKQEAREMVAEVRRQISEEGFSREDIMAGHVLFLTMRYDAAELATLIALLTYEQAKVEA